MSLRSKVQNKYLVDLESGGFGSIYSIEHLKTKEQYAAKIIKGREDIIMKKMINWEISIMMHLQNLTIINFYRYSLIDMKERDNVTILMNIAQNGSIQTHLTNVQMGLADSR